jgi:hypothetical protein
VDGETTVYGPVKSAFPSGLLASGDSIETRYADAIFLITDGGTGVFNIKARVVSGSSIACRHYENVWVKPFHVHPVGYDLQDHTFGINAASPITGGPVTVKIYTTNNAETNNPTWTLFDTITGITEGSVQKGIDLSARFSGTGYKGVRLTASGDCRLKADVTYTCEIRTS